MPDPETNPVVDSVPKVNEIAVGEDLAFQRKWWRFERIIWLLFVVILVCDLLGLFGRGWFSKAKCSTPDHALTVDYQRIERASTPSTLTLHFDPSSVQDRHIVVFVSNGLIKSLGARRISPQPAISALSEGGVTYTFDVRSAPTIVEIRLQPQMPGEYAFRIQTAGNAPIRRTVLVVP